MSDLSFHPIDTAPPPVPVHGRRPEKVSRIQFHSILWPVVLSLVVMGIISYFTFDATSFRALLTNLNPWLLGAAVGTVVLRVVSGGWRLNYVSHGKLGLMGGIRGQLAWDFFSNITPSTVGGGPIAAAYIARDRNLPLGEATSIMLFSMLLDQIWFALSIPGIIGCTLFFEVIPVSLGAVGYWSFTLYFVGFMGWVLVFGYCTLVRPHLLEKLVDGVFRLRFLRRFRGRALRVMQQLRRRATVLRRQPVRFYAASFALTLLTWVSRYLLVVFILWSVYPALDHLLVVLRTMALTLGSVVLPTPGGAGGLEGLYAIFFGPPMIPQALVAPTLLTWRLLGYYIFIALGAFLSMHHMQQTIRRKQQAENDLSSSNGDGHNVPLPIEPVLEKSED